MNDEELKAKLNTWAVRPDFRTDFTRNVWVKIAQEQSRAGNSWWAKALEVFRIYPRLATSGGFSLLLVFGLSIAHLAAQQTNASRWGMMEQAYVQSINPLDKTMP